MKMNYEKVTILNVTKMTEEEYEVEAIRDYRIHRGKEQFFVKWKGYQEEDNSWENLSNLFCDFLIKKYQKENKDKIEKIKSQAKQLKEENKKTKDQTKSLKEESKKIKDQSKPSRSESRKSRNQPKRIVKVVYKDNTVKYVFEQGTEKYSTTSNKIDDVEQHLIISYFESNCNFTVDDDL